MQPKNSQFNKVNYWEIFENNCPKGPLVLTIHLKRFENIQGKINKVSRHINFQETLSLKSYMSHETSESLVYDLQGIIVHVGPLCESGHYYSCIKNSNGIWHQVQFTHRILLFNLILDR